MKKETEKEKEDSDFANGSLQKKKFGITVLTPPDNPFLVSDHLMREKRRHGHRLSSTPLALPYVKNIETDSRPDSRQNSTSQIHRTFIQDPHELPVNLNYFDVTFVTYTLEGKGPKTMRSGF